MSGKRWRLGIRRERPAGDEDLGDANLYDLAALIARLGAHGDAAAVGAGCGGGRCKDFPAYAERISRPHRLEPVDLGAESDAASGEPRSAIEKESHRESRGVPAACDETAEDRRASGRGVEVKGLRIELGRESLDLRLIDRARALSGEALPGLEVLEVQARVRAFIACHDEVCNAWIRMDAGDARKLYLVTLPYGVDRWNCSGESPANIARAACGDSERWR